MMAATIVGCSACAAAAPPLEDIPFLPKWDSVFTLKGGGGYKDNVTLSHAAPEGSPFVSASAEAILSRLYLDGSQLNFLFSGDERHYLSAASVENEQFVFGQAQLKKSLGESSEGSLAADYTYLNQVVDLSVTETNRTPLLVRGHSFTARPGFRYEFERPFWVAFEAPVTRQIYTSSLDNLWQYGGKLTAGHGYGHRSELSLSYELSRHAYDTYQALAADGTPLTDTQRVLNLHDLRLTWRHYWDADRHWRTTVRLGGRFGDDPAFGYFDYTQFYGYTEVRYRTKAWEISGDAKFAHYEYPVQTVSTSDLRHRARSEMFVNFRGARRLYKGLRLVSEVGFEEVFSNDRLETYSATTISGGLEWEF